MHEKPPEKEQERKGSENMCDLDFMFVDVHWLVRKKQSSSQDSFPEILGTEPMDSFLFLFLFLVSKMTQTMSHMVVGIYLS